MARLRGSNSNGIRRGARYQTRSGPEKGKMGVTGEPVHGTDPETRRRSGTAAPPESCASSGAVSRLRPALLTRGRCARRAARGTSSGSPASGRATLYSYVINHKAPGFEDDAVPIAVVELEEGPRMMTNIIRLQATPEALTGHAAAGQVRAAGRRRPACSDPAVREKHDDRWLAPPEPMAFASCRTTPRCSWPGGTLNTVADAACRCATSTASPPCPRRAAGRARAGHHAALDQRRRRRGTSFLLHVRDRGRGHPAPGTPGRC